VVLVQFVHYVEQMEPPHITGCMETKESRSLA
jgi:hypothetical protein